MSFVRHHEEDLITVWGLADDDLGACDWITYLEKERARLARKGIPSEIVKMPSLRVKRGKVKRTLIYALKRVVSAVREDPPKRPATSEPYTPSL